MVTATRTVTPLGASLKSLVNGFVLTKQTEGKIPRTEEYHLEGVEPQVKELYQTIKSRLSEFKPTLRFNPQKYYISIIDKKNFAYIYIRRKKINLTVMLPENIIRNSIKHHKVESESEGVQKFYGGECATITIEDNSNLDEVIDTLKMPLTSKA